MPLESRHYWAFPAKLHPNVLSWHTSQTLPRERVAYPIQKANVEALRIYRVTTIAGQPGEPHCLFTALACNLHSRPHLVITEPRSERSTEGELVEASACSDNSLWLKDILSGPQRCTAVHDHPVSRHTLLHSYELYLHPQQKAHLLLLRAALQLTTLPVNESMESMQGVHSTRDSRTMDLDTAGLLHERGILRPKTVQTRGLFHFMELPPEIRVKVRPLFSPE